MASMLTPDSQSSWKDFHDGCVAPNDTRIWPISPLDTLSQGSFTAPTNSPAEPENSSDQAFKATTSSLTEPGISNTQDNDGEPLNNRTPGRTSSERNLQGHGRTSRMKKPQSQILEKAYHSCSRRSMSKKATKHYISKVAGCSFRQAEHWIWNYSRRLKSMEEKRTSKSVSPVHTSDPGQPQTHNTLMPSRVHNEETQPVNADVTMESSSAAGSIDQLSGELCFEDYLNDPSDSKDPYEALGSPCQLQSSMWPEEETTDSIFCKNTFHENAPVPSQNVQQPLASGPNGGNQDPMMVQSNALPLFSSNLDNSKTAFFSTMSDFVRDNGCASLRSMGHREIARLFPNLRGWPDSQLKEWSRFPCFFGHYAHHMHFLESHLQQPSL